MGSVAALLDESVFQILFIMSCTLLYASLHQQLLLIADGQQTVLATGH